jgi:hypothetical protein
MVDGLYDAAYPLGRSVVREPTDIERDLGVAGQYWPMVGLVKPHLMLTVGGETFKIECTCPWHPFNVAKEGCLIHNRSPGGPWTIERLRTAPAVKVLS